MVGDEQWEQRAHGAAVWVMQDLGPRMGLLQEGFVLAVGSWLRDDAEQGAVRLCAKLHVVERWPQPSAHLKC